MIMYIPKTSPSMRQALVALGPIIITVALGMVEGYSAILLPQLQANTSSIVIDEEEASWIASAAALPMALGCIVGGYVMERHGRKFAHQLCCPPCLAGWLLIYLSDGLPALLSGRLLTGFCIGLLGPPTGVYISETSSPRLRGLFLAAISAGIALGIFLAHLAGTFLHWRLAALVCAALPVAAFVCMLGTPESPTYHARRGDEGRAREAFRWCRGSGADADAEIATILERQAALRRQNTSWAEELHQLVRPEFLKPLGIMAVFFVMMQWSGLNAMAFYTVAIVRQTVGGNMDEYLAMLLVDGVRLTMSVAACWISKRTGRRPLALTSGLGTAGSLLVLSAYSYAAAADPAYERYYPVAVAGLVAYIVFITVGLVPLPWTMMGEVFPLRSRGLGSGLSALVTYAACFSVVKTTPAMFGQLGGAGAFLIYGAVALGGTVFLYFFLPETKDKVLHDIEDGFKGGIDGGDGGGVRSQE